MSSGWLATFCKFIEYLVLAGGGGITAPIATSQILFVRLKYQSKAWNFTYERRGSPQQSISQYSLLNARSARTWD
jgi:hypothetical protein